MALCVHVSAVRAGARGTHEERARRGIRRIPLCRAGGLEALLMAEAANAVSAPRPPACANKCKPDFPIHFMTWKGNGLRRGAPQTCSGALPTHLNAKAIRNS